MYKDSISAVNYVIGKVHAYVNNYYCYGLLIGNGFLVNALIENW